MSIWRKQRARFTPKKTALIWEVVLSILPSTNDKKRAPQDQSVIKSGKETRPSSSPNPEPKNLRQEVDGNYAESSALHQHQYSDHRWNCGQHHISCQNLPEGRAAEHRCQSNKSVETSWPFLTPGCLAPLLEAHPDWTPPLTWALNGCAWLRW